MMKLGFEPGCVAPELIYPKSDLTLRSASASQHTSFCLLGSSSVLSFSAVLEPERDF